MHHYVLTKRKLLEQVKKKLAQYGMTQLELAGALNLFIPEEDPKVSEGKSGAVQVGRWLQGSVDPSCHITLALLAFIQTMRRPTKPSPAPTSTKRISTQPTENHTKTPTERTTDETMRDRQEISSSLAPTDSSAKYYTSNLNKL
jgi:transcriptional regulator with XRE-family HTH domain